MTRIAGRVELYTEEINAAVREASTWPARRIIVMDCHGAGQDWRFSSLIPTCSIQRADWSAATKWTGYTEMFVEMGCDAAL